MAILDRSFTFRHQVELPVDSSTMLECTLVKCRRLAFKIFERTVAVITNTGVLSPVRVEFRTRGQFEQAMLFATQAMQVGRNPGLIDGRTVKVRMGMCLRMHSRSSFQTDQAISTLSVPDIASIKGVMFRVSRRPCKSA